MKKGLIIIFILLLSALSIAVGVKLSKGYKTQIALSAKSLVEQQVKNQINLTVLPLIQECTTNRDLVAIKEEPATINVDGPTLSLLSAKTLVSLQQVLGLYHQMMLSLPRGALIGSTYLADKGRMTDYTVTTDYTTECKYVSSLECVGINRVRYAIYLNIIVNASIVIPAQAGSITVSQYLPVFEYVFAGEVPGVYVNGENGTNYLDLIP